MRMKIVWNFKLEIVFFYIELRYEEQLTKYINLDLWNIYKFRCYDIFLINSIILARFLGKKYFKIFCEKHYKITKQMLNFR